MAKYHINPEIGNAGKCSALCRCPFGDVEHYGSESQARKAYERSMREQLSSKPMIYGGVPCDTDHPTRVSHAGYCRKYGGV